MKQPQLKRLGDLRLVLGFLSVLASLAIWFYTAGSEPLTQAHGERFGLFAGLWAPTFFILSNRFARYAEKTV